MNPTVGPSAGIGSVPAVAALLPGPVGAEGAVGARGEVRAFFVGAAHVPGSDGDALDPMPPCKNARVFRGDASFGG